MSFTLGSYGQIASPTVPGGAVNITAGTDIASVIAAHSPGTDYYLRSGTHRSQSFQPKTGDTFVFESGAILNGSELLSSWVASGANWYANVVGFSSPIDGGECIGGGGLCTYGGDIFYDDVAFRRVGSLGALVSGRYYHDTAAGRVYIHDDPSGHVVERSNQPIGIFGSATGVTIDNPIVQKYANPAQHGAIEMGVDWAVNACTAELNHGIGVRVNTDAVVTACQLNNNGQMGIGGSGTDVVVDGNEIGFNDSAFYDPGWEAGGSKFTFTVGMILNNNWAHSNLGPGLWFDIDNINFTITNNLSEDNYSLSNAASPGIFIEISYGGTIHDNICRRNGSGFSDWIWGAGILIAASGGVGLTIYNNEIEDNEHGIALIQQNRGSGAYGAHLVQNVEVYSNVVRMAQGFTGAVQDYGGNAIFDSLNNTWHDNEYHLASADQFTWQNSPTNQAGWQGFGNDTGGTFVIDGGAGTGGGGGATTTLLASMSRELLTLSLLSVADASFTGDAWAGDDPSGTFRAEMRRSSDGKILVTRDFNFQAWRLVEADLSAFTPFSQQFPADHDITSNNRPYRPKGSWLTADGMFAYVGWGTSAGTTDPFFTCLQKIDLSDWSVVDEWPLAANTYSTASSQAWKPLGVSPDDATAYYILTGGPNVQNKIYAIDLGTGTNSVFATIGTDVGGSGVPRTDLLNDGVVLSNGKIVVGAHDTDGTFQLNYKVHVVDTDGTLLSSTNVTVEGSAGVTSTSLKPFVEDPDGSVWFGIHLDSLNRIDPAGPTLISQLAVPQDVDSNYMDIVTLTIVPEEAEEEPPPSPTPPTTPPPVIVGSTPCCDTAAPGGSHPGPALPPIGPFWTPSCNGGGVTSLASPITLVERWDY